MAEVFGVEDPDGKVCDIQQSRLENIERSIEKMQSPMPSREWKGGSVAGKAAWLPLLFDNHGNPLPFPLLASPAPAGAKGGATPSASSKGKGKGKGKDPLAAAASMGYRMPGYY